MGSDGFAARLDELLAADDADRALRFPGVSTARQPVHTAYVPADTFAAGTVTEWGRLALAALDAHGPLPTPDLVAQTDAVRAKLAREPVEDLRIDLEDGYGVRPDDVEDADVDRAAAALGHAIGEGIAAPFCGIRIKSFDPAVRRRGVRSLDRFLSRLLETGPLPAGFRITLPKVTSVAQVAAMAELCDSLESAHGLPAGDLVVEVQVETPQAVLGPDGTSLVAAMIHAMSGRCAGLHYGTYDYSASLGIAAAQQSLAHPAADHAKSVMQVAAALTGVPVSDGSTNVLPVGDTTAVRDAWSLHAGLVRRSLERGFYQGWDLHPAQLPTRYAATFAFFRSGLATAAGRLRGYLDRQASAVAEEPATAQALAGYLLRGVHCGAISDAELEAHAGVNAAGLVALLTAG